MLRKRRRLNSKAIEVFVILFLIWWLIYLGNVINLSRKKDEKFDGIYLLGKYHYHDVWRRLLLLEEMTKVKQTQLRRFMFIVKRNYSKSGILNTRRYAKFIEPVFEKILINHYGDNWNYFWKNSNTLTRIHFFYILSIPFWYFVFIQIAFDTEEISSQFFFAIWPLIAVVLMYMGIMIVVNIVFYYFAISLLGLFKFESGILNRNVSALEGVTDSIKFYKNSAIILGISGILSSFFISKAAGFKGMGGGKFGGGGASGKW